MSPDNHFQQNWGQQQYQGLGYFQQPSQPPPPRKRGNLVVILSILALVVIIGAVVTIVLVNRGGDEQPQAQPPNQPTSTTRSPAPQTPSDELAPRNPGWSVIKNERAALIYEVPPVWTPAPGGEVTSKTLDGVVLSFPATLQDYTCEGKKYSRGGLGGGTVARSDLAQVATSLAKGLGEEFYASATPTVQVTEPVELTIDGPDGAKVKGVRADAIVTTTGNPCMASKGTVAVAVFDSSDKYSFLVVNTDTTGGPPTPPPSDPRDLESIIKSVRMY